MAGFFQSFRSSAMPKRLLRYAMAKFDIFEDDALDLENLDLGFGFKNTFEFKDVGLKVEKVTKQLGLPAGYRINKAKVSRLQLTVPLDIYSSSIELHAAGVHISLEIASSDNQSPSPSESRNEAATSPHSVPTAADLTQSFLETQPARDKRALEDALAAERQDLGASVSLSEDGSEEDLTYGTGQGLTLPDFLTDFLQGVVDRTRITIRDVNFHLGVEVPLESNSPGTELVSIHVSLDALYVQGVTVQNSEEDTFKFIPKEGKRHVLLSDIRAYIISEADSFSNFSRSPAGTPAASKPPVLIQRAPASPRRRREPSPDLEPYHLANSGVAPEQNEPPVRDSAEAFLIPYDENDLNTVTQLEESDGDPASSLSTPRASVYHEVAGQQADTSIRPLDAMNDPVTWPLATDRALLESEIAASDDSLENSVSSASASDSSGTPSGEDLAQSQLFTHEEAESMYMSAFSEAEFQQPQGRSMPGSWDFAAEDAVPPSSHSPAAGLASLHLQTPEKKDDNFRQASVPQGHETTTIIAPDKTAPRPESVGASETKAASKPTEDLRASLGQLHDSSKLVKEILSMDSISVHIPIRHKHVQITNTNDQASLADSAVRNIPGAFSVYSAIPQNLDPNQSLSESLHAEMQGDENQSVDVHLGPVQISLDLSVGFLLATISRRLLEAAKSSKAVTPNDGGATVQNASTRPELPRIHFSTDNICVSFLESVALVAATKGSAKESDIETLLRAELDRFGVTVSHSGSSTETRMSIERFRFGFHDSDILTFDRDVQMRASVRDTFPEAGADISLRVSQTEKYSRCEINTLPLRVHLDVQRLDETLSWFGGLSGFLQMGSSMTSNSGQTKHAIKPAKPRGVRFDIPAQKEPTDVPSETKTDVRIGGLQIDLIGKKCGVRVRSTAVKIISREGLIGVGISKTQVSGPHFDSDSDEPPVSVAISNARLDFLTSPRDDDLDRLLALITPSKGQFEEGDDEIMVDTLLRQRRKGSVLKLTIDDVQTQVTELSCLDVLSSLGEDLARLGTVAKYLPEDDRPGLLTLGLIRNLEASVDVGGRFGIVNAHLDGLEMAHITFPTLAAFGVQSIKVDRNKIEDLVGTYDNINTGISSQSPVLMVRMIGDEMEPVIKIRMRNISFEYRVPTAMDILGLSSESTPQDFDAMLAASVANLGEKAHHVLVRGEPLTQSSVGSSKTEATKPTVVNVDFRNCLIGLNPLGLTSKLAIILVDTHVEASVPRDDDVNAVASLRKAAILLIDDVSLLESAQPTTMARRRGSDAQRPMDMVSSLCSKGYVNICQISSARATVQATTDDDGEKCVNVDLRDDLLVLETCADSFHTLTALAGALKPPTPPSKEVKYKTEVIPVQDLLASITADAFGKAEGDYDFDDDFAIAQGVGADSGSLDGELVDPSPMETKSQFFSDEVAESIFDATSSSIISDQTTTRDKRSLKPNATALSEEFGVHSEIEVHENFFAAEPSSDGAAHYWNSARNRYDESGATKIHRNPLNVRVRDVHVIWNLFDGYDWQHTRDAITKTVEEVESQAYERRTRSGRRSMDDPDLEDQDVIGDCLFNSIYVSIPANHDPRELVGGINHMLDDTESLAATSVTTTTTRTGVGQFKSRARKLRLGRSRRHKITFELQGVSVDMVKFPPGSGETDASIDVRVHNLDIFDHVPTSTWKKFATYDQDAGERELGTSMVHLEVLMVKPVPELAAAEFVMKATVLPLRLHVDQDALDFITRFFQFKDESQSSAPSPSDEAFIQRAEINSIPVVLDFKPKRVDYAGLRGGRTSEFMNFMILESARMTLRHTIVYGTTGWERLGNTLNDIWTPDVKRTQLAGVLAGVAPVRHLVNVGSGFRDLIEIPVKEYRKDGRIVRSLGKGAAAFARTTGTEIVKLGAKMAVGTQYVLQGAEGILTKDAGEGSSGAGDVAPIQSGWEEEDMEAEEKKQISLYADQPTGVIQGLRHAYSSLARDLNVTRDAIIAVPAEVMESQNAQGAARAVMRRAPTIIFRPAIGATRAVGQALMGATNALDPENLRRVENKYKSGPGR